MIFKWCKIVAVSTFILTLDLNFMPWLQNLLKQGNWAIKACCLIFFKVIFPVTYVVFAVYSISWENEKYAMHSKLVTALVTFFLIEG